MKHRGTIKQLEAILKASGHPVKSTEEKDTYFRITTTHGAICNWFPSNGTVVFQGKEEKRKALQTAVDRYMKRREARQADTQRSKPEPKPQPGKPARSVDKKVFIAHGHDTRALTELQLILHQLKLDPVVLVNEGRGGQTHIESLEKAIGGGPGQARIGIVLLTPDDVAYAVKTGGSNPQPRARQNVVMELGVLISKVGRKRTIILKKGDLEIPSNAHGIIYFEFREHVKEVAPKLCKRFMELGFNFSPEAIARAGA